MNNEIDHRRQSFVNWQIQGNLVFRLVGYVVLYHFILWNVMFLHCYLQYQGELEAGGRVQTFGELYGNFALEHYSVLVCAIAVFPLLVWDGIRFSHRVAGPLVRLQNVLKQLSQGHRSPEVKLRKGDLMEQLAETVNELLRSQKIQTQAELLQQEQVASVVSAHEEHQLLEVIEQLHSITGAGFSGEATTQEPSSRKSSQMDQILLNTEEKWS